MSNYILCRTLFDKTPIWGLIAHICGITADKWGIIRHFYGITPQISRVKQQKYGITLQPIVVRSLIDNNRIFLMTQPPRLLDRVRQTLRLKHFSLQTEKSYVYYVKQFILFHHKRHPRDMGVDEIRAYLTHLAVEKNVALHNISMKCPKCESIQISNNGCHHGKQNYICKHCGRQFIASNSPIGYSTDVKQMCLTMYLNAMGFCTIERVTSINHNTMIN